MTEPFTVNGKTVLITGANRGLGEALVAEAVRLGADRVYAGTRHAFAHPDARVTAVLLDVTDVSQIRSVVEAIDEVDLLINNAGVAAGDAITSWSDIESHVMVNLRGPFEVSNALRPQLAAARGAIVNVLSLAALASVPMLAAYSISKAAAFSLTQAQRAHYARDGIQVHAVLAGPIDTEMTRDLELPKTPAADVAGSIFAGLQAGHDEIFPDSFAQMFADGWRAGQLKQLERQNAELLKVLAG
jgi:NAD(P)-dependent dehydrogenase (short-subunit alcohol dehydrogenase family)